MKSIFCLHERIAEDSVSIARLTLCDLRLQNVQTFPWLVLVPCLPNLREFTDLSADDAHLLMDEIRLVADILVKIYKPYKINIGALGNMVPQLHIHVVARFTSDPAWPGPVWGFQKTHKYSVSDLSLAIAAIKSILFD